MRDKNWCSQYYADHFVDTFDDDDDGGSELPWKYHEAKSPFKGGEKKDHWYGRAGVIFEYNANLVYSALVCLLLVGHDFFWSPIAAILCLW